MTGNSHVHAAEPARVAVLQTSSERDHNTDAGWEAFAEITVPWITFKFYDETSVDSFIHGIAERRFTAVCFASNSLFNPVTFEATLEAAEEIASASQEGMGIVIAQQFLPTGVTRSCDFLPVAHRLEYRGCGRRMLHGISVLEDGILDTEEPLSIDAATFGSREPVLWSTVKQAQPNAWCPLLKVRVDGEEHVGLMRTRRARGRVIASTLHLDWIADRRLLTYAINLAVRPRGTLFIHPPGDEQTHSVGLELLLGRSVARGGHLSYVAVDDPATVRSTDPPFKHFSHLVVSEAWGWPELTGLAEQGLHGRLENGGSVSAFGSVATASGERVLATVRGRPRYLTLADDFAVWYEANVSRFQDAPTTQVRALIAAAKAVVEATSDADEAPPSLELEELGRRFADYFRDRLRGLDHADAHVLPTASIASAMSMVGRPPADVQPLLRWIRNGDYVSSFASQQQAQLWLPDLGLKLSEEPTSELERIYADLLALRSDPLRADVVDRLVARLGDPAVPLVRKAIIAESLSQSEERETLAKTASAAAALQNDLERALASGRGPLEIVSLLTACFVRIHASEELDAGHLVYTPPRAAAVADFEPGLRSGQQAAREETRRVSDALEETRNFARRIVASVVMLLVLFVLAVSALGVAEIESSWAVRISVLLVVASTTVAVIGYIGRRAAAFNCEPRLLREFRELKPG